MSELREKILGLQVQLMTKDSFAQSPLCDEVLRLIEELDNEDAKIELCKLVLLYLIDLERMEDAQGCIDMLMAHADYRSHLSALWARSIICQRKKEVRGYAQCFDEGIAIASEHNDTEALAEGYLFRGKAMIYADSLDEALEDLNKSIMYATDEKNFKLVATCKYYIGFVLLAMDHVELGMEQLRDASEIAHEQKSQSIIMHTEVVRALYYLGKGENDAALKVLSSWFEEFKMML